MSETTEMILEGLLCDVCGDVIDGECTGYPRSCYGCEWEKVLKKAEERNKKLTKE